MNMKFEYIQVYNHLKELMRLGSLKAGDKLPSERSLMDTLKVSRTTVRRALELLQNEKVVEKRPGVGCILRAANLEEAAATDEAMLVAEEPGQYSVSQSTAATGEKEGQKRAIGIGIDLESLSSSLYQQQIVSEVRKVSLKGCEVKLDLMGSDRWKHKDVNCDGILLSHISYMDMKALERDYHGTVPLLLLNRIPEREDFGYLAVDYEEVSYRIVSHLLRNGAERVMLAGAIGRPELENGYAEYVRTQGWMRAYRELTGSVPGDLTFGRFLSLEIVELTERLKRQHPEVLYVLTMSELPVAWAAILQAGLVPGKDISVICFDDVEAYRLPYQPISFVRMPIRQMARMAVEYFSRGKDGGVLRKCLEPQFIIDSCPYFL